MSDLIGQTFGHYRIVDKIGEGGMGEVYRAHDEQLDRDVAIKVLPVEVADNPDRLERFEREAKAVARLDHPNILAIHDFGTEDGVTYAVMELLEGQNLRHVIPDSGMPWRKAIEVAAAIADGLAAAHGKGVIHRDLKPENVFITSDGRVKVLDFGLARVKEPVEEEAETATLTPAGTAAGTVMGTLGYMAPEQLRGEPADAGSDIFALGCVLYELLSGRAAFLRQSTAETTAAILKEEPPTLSDSRVTLPVELERAVRRCLEKSASARFQSAADLAYNLRSIATGPSVPVMTERSDGTTVSGDPSKPIFRRYAFVAAGLVVALGTLWWVLSQRGPEKKAQTLTPKFESMTITPVTTVGSVVVAAISPDGRQLAYLRFEGGQRTICVRQVATGSEVEVVQWAKWLFRGLVFTPDGEYVYFARQENPSMNSILRVPTLGGEVKRIVEDADGQPCFSPDGKRIAFSRGITGRGDALMVANADGSEQRELAVVKVLAFLSWSSNGRTIAAFEHMPEGWQLLTFEADTGRRSHVATGIVFKAMSGCTWVPGSDDLIVAGTIHSEMENSQIWRLSTKTGTLRRITNDPNNYFWVSLSADGKALATVLKQSVSHLYVAPADEPQDIRQLTRGSRELVEGFDTDERSVFFERATDGQNVGIWTCKDDGSDLRRIDIGRLEVYPFFPWVSANKGVLLFTAKDANGRSQIWRLDGKNGSPMQVTAAEYYAFGPSLSPDGSWFVYSESGVSRLGPGGKAWRMQTGGGNPTLISADSRWAVLSPDGEKIGLVVSRENDDDVLESVLEVIPVGGGEPLMSTPWRDFFFPRWRPDSQALTYVVYRDGQLWLQPLNGGPPEQLTHLDPLRVIDHAWSEDGQRLFLALGESTTDAVLIRNF